MAHVRAPPPAPEPRVETPRPGRCAPSAAPGRPGHPAARRVLAQRCVRVQLGDGVEPLLQRGAVAQRLQQRAPQQSRAQRPCASASSVASSVAPPLPARHDRRPRWLDHLQRAPCAPIDLDKAARYHTSAGRSAAAATLDSCVPDRRGSRPPRRWPAAVITAERGEPGDAEMAAAGGTRALGLERSARRDVQPASQSPSLVVVAGCASARSASRTSAGASR